MATMGVGYEQLAALLDYPDESTGAKLRACLAESVGQTAEVARLLEEWAGYFEATPLWAVQELYTRTFDLNPSCSLDVGYYLFGEDFQRGVFLAHLRESQEAAGMAPEIELPDHLPVILRWLARIYGTEICTDMVRECVLPTIRRMDNALAPARDAHGNVEGGANPYREVLQAVALVLQSDLAEMAEPADVCAAGGR
ncbi:MAG: nitrate reductase molybdenum cofactor assembly chaperone [Chthonomonadales bacterium]|nr:nitrate reductase molybdenum cofactor assembly chaperone [Chthonomonadales bacterium]